MKEKKSIEPFASWIRRQADRDDAIGRIGKKVIAEEADLGRPLRCLEDQPNFAMFVRRVAKTIGVEDDLGRSVWREWAASVAGG